MKKLVIFFLICSFNYPFFLIGCEPMEENSKKIAIVGGRNDIAEELYGTQDHGYFLIDYNTEARPHIVRDINKPLESDEKLSNHLRTFDRVIFENTHVQTFNPIAIKNGLDLLLDGGILSMSAFPKFRLISQEYYNTFNYHNVTSVSVGENEIPFQVPHFSVPYTENEQSKCAQFFLCSPTIKRHEGSIFEIPTKDRVWEFVYINAQEDGAIDIDDKDLSKTAKASASTGSSLGSEEEKKSSDEEESKELPVQSSNYELPNVYMDYNNLDFIHSIKSYLRIQPEYLVEFRSFQKTNQEWVSKYYPSSFGFFITKTIM
ncbi:MAG: hypothetical protein ACH349_07195 [Candidatus Rhabdochlamydia sp.]